MINKTKKATRALTFPAGVMTKSKRSQEEMVGFVLIIIIVTIIGLFFMFFMSHQSKPYAQSNEVESFLQSSLLYSSPCTMESGASQLNMQYLAEACSKNQVCSDGISSCEILNQTMSGLIESAFNINPEARYKAYRFSIKSDETSILDLKKGNLTGNIYGAEVKFFTSSGNMNMTLRLYF